MKTNSGSPACSKQANQPSGACLRLRAAVNKVLSWRQNVLCWHCHIFNEDLSENIHQQNKLKCACFR